MLNMGNDETQNQIKQNGHSIFIGMIIILDCSNSDENKKYIQLVSNCKRRRETKSNRV